MKLEDAAIRFYGGSGAEFLKSKKMLPGNRSFVCTTFEECFKQTPSELNPGANLYIGPADPCGSINDFKRRLYAARSLAKNALEEKRGICGTRLVSARAKRPFIVQRS